MDAENTFVCEVRVSVPQSERQRLFRWLNTQHTGRPEIPSDATVSAEHRDAAYRMCSTLAVFLRCSVSRDGELALEQL